MPTHYRGGAQEQVALDAYVKLMRAAESATALIGGIFPRHAQHVVRELSLADQTDLGRLCRQLGRGLGESRGKEVGNGATSHPLRLAPAF